MIVFYTMTLLATRCGDTLGLVVGSEDQLVLARPRPRAQLEPPVGTLYTTVVLNPVQHNRCTAFITKT